MVGSVSVSAGSAVGGRGAVASRMSGVGVSPLHIRLLGGLAVEGLDEREIGSRKGRTVLKVLALGRGAPVATDRLAYVLWGDDPPARAAEQVGVLVSRLRAVLGSERVVRTDAGYALRCDSLDLDELERRVAEAERRHASGQMVAARAAAEAALALVRGPLLPDEDGEWVEMDRVAAERMAHRARMVVADAALDAGDHGAAVAAAEVMLAADPYDEAALRALIRAHAVAGRPASALAAYANVRERLAEDLGVPPAPETEELHDALVLGEGPTGAESMAPVPPVLAGRERELALLGASLSEAATGQARLVVIEGEPGIGKTAITCSTCAIPGTLASRSPAMWRCSTSSSRSSMPTTSKRLTRSCRVPRLRWPPGTARWRGAPASVPVCCRRG